MTDPTRRRSRATPARHRPAAPQALPARSSSAARATSEADRALAPRRSGAAFATSEANRALSPRRSSTAHATSEADRALPRRGSGAAHATSEAGQATVEVVAIFPLLLAVVVAAFALLTAGAARESAASAAQAGAMALLQDADATAAARSVLERTDRGPAKVVVAGRRVTVTVKPRRLGPLAALLTVHSSAQAGPGVPAAGRSVTTVRGGDGRGAAP